MVDKPQSLLELDALKAWIGRRELAIDRVDQQRVQQLAASLDLDHHDFQQGSVLPPLWHWIFATPISAMHQAGPDGHAARGGFLPPVPLPRRMWAGSRLHWHQDFKLADTISRESTVSAIETKSGRSGELVLSRSATNGGETMSLCSMKNTISFIVIFLRLKRPK